MKLEKNVVKYMREFGEALGNSEWENFELSASWDMDGYNISSPIEQILYMALVLVRRLAGIKDCEPVEYSNGNIKIEGVRIIPQFSIDKYRVDFLITYLKKDIKNSFSPIERSVVVECDSQKFHDTSETQRRYEKERDRFIQKSGYKVFRYTGSEILKNPYKISAEILSHVSGEKETDIIDCYINHICTN